MDLLRRYLEENSGVLVLGHSFAYLLSLGSIEAVVFDFKKFLIKSFHASFPLLAHLVSRCWMKLYEILIMLHLGQSHAFRILMSRWFVDRILLRSATGCLPRLGRQYFSCDVHEYPTSLRRRCRLSRSDFGCDYAIHSFFVNII